MSNENDWEEVPTENNDSDWEEVTTEQGPSEVSPMELAKTATGGAIGYGVGKAAAPVIEKGAEKLLDPAAELLAYRGAGGYSGLNAGKELNQAMVEKKAGNAVRGIQELASGNVFDEGVSPRSVGREVLEKDLLGPMGLGLKSSNAARAKENLFRTSGPTNAILNEASEYPVFQSPIFERMKQVLGYDELNSTVPDQAKIKKELDKLNETSFSGVETPMQAERAKRDLQIKADFADPDKTVKNALNTAQATARKEAVENAIEQALGPEKLEEFRRLKAQSGSAAVASNLLDDVYSKSQNGINGWKGVIGTGLDFVNQRGSGIAANALDKVSSMAKKGSKMLAPGLGTLVGLTVGAAAADEQTDSADFIPGLDQATPAGNPMDEKMIQAETQALRNYENSPARANATQSREEFLKKALEKVDPSFRGGYAYKQAEQELKQLQNPQKQLVSDSKSLKEATPDQLMELSNNFRNIKGADRFVAPLENAAQADSEEERQARLFGLYQQPAFRQLLKKDQK